MRFAPYLLLVVGFLAWNFLTPVVAQASETIVDFPSLQRACDSAIPGAVIDIPDGIYHGELVIRRSLTLRGSSSAILRHVPFAQGPTIAIHANKTTISGITVEGSGEGSISDHYAIVVAADEVTIKAVTVRDAWGGVYLNQASGTRLSGLVLEGLKDWQFFQRGDAIHVLGGSNSHFSDLALSHWADGVYADQTTDITIEKVVGKDLRYGIHSMYSSKGVLQNSSITNSVVGFMFMESQAWNVENCRWTDCLATGGAGLRIVRSSASSFVNCVSARNLTGVQLLDVTMCSFSGLLVEANATGFRLGGSNLSCTVTSASVRGNLVQISADPLKEGDLKDTPLEVHKHVKSPLANLNPAWIAKSDDSTTRLSRIPEFTMNYWDDWQGYDLDADGIGDSAYLFNEETSGLYAQHPLLGIFLGSPFRNMVEPLGAGGVIDRQPLVRSPKVYQ